MLILHHSTKFMVFQAVKYIKNSNSVYHLLCIFNNLKISIADHTLTSDEEFFRKRSEEFANLNDDPTSTRTSSSCPSPASTIVREAGEIVKDQQREDENKVQGLVQACGGLYHEAVSYTHLTLPTNREV